MRELKFRAWDEDLKRYFYDVTVYPNNIVAIQRHNIESMMLEAEYGATHCTELGKNAVIEQYTGLKDKNGKEIYEGDIVKFNETICTVQYDEAYARYTLRDQSDGVQMFFDCLIIIPFEVIGNIHENPGLLEGE